DVLRFLGGTGNDRITAVEGGMVAGVTDSAGLATFGGRPSGTNVFIWDGQSFTLFGGSGDEEPTALRGALVGWTTSRDFPLIGPQSFQRDFGGGKTDGFVIFRPGTAAVYSVASYLGGSGDDRIMAVTPDPSFKPQRFSDSVGYILAGETNSTDFPVRAAIQPALAGGKDGFLTRVGTEGLIAESTYWGGSGDDTILAVDAMAGTCWFAGRTSSPDLRTLAPLQAQLSGSSDGFIARLTTSAIPSRPDFATYYGGTGDDEIRALRIGPDSWIWTGGNTTSPDLPLITASQTALAGDADAWIARFDPVRFLPSFATYWGGSGHDELTAIVHDANGDLYAAGFTNSGDLAVINPLQPQPGGGDDGFIARFDNHGQPQMATYAGGTGSDRLRSISVFQGKVTAGGESDSATLPQLTLATGVAGAAPPSNAGQFDGLLIQFHEDGIYAAPAVVGQNLTATFPVSLAGAGTLGLPITVISGDPSRLLVNGGAFSTAATFQLTALAGDAVIDVVVSLPGFTPRHVPVTLRPSYLVNPAPSAIFIPLNATTAINFSFATTDPATGDLITQPLRQGFDPAVAFISGDTTVVLSPLNYNAVSQTVAATLRGVRAGTASINIVSPLFPVSGPGILNVTVGQTGGGVLTFPDLLIGDRLQTWVPLALSSDSPAVAGGAQVVFTSEDPSRVVVSLASGTAGTASLTLDYAPGGNQKIWLQTRAASGVVRIRVEMAGSAPVYFNVALAPAMVQIATPAETSNAYFSGVHHNPNLNTVSLSRWSTRTVFGLVVQPDGVAPGGYAVRDQLPAPGFAGTLQVESSDKSVIPLSESFGFVPSNGNAFVLFYVPLLKAGTAALNVTGDGFISRAPIQVTVLPDDIPFSKTELTLGKGLQTVAWFDSVYDFPPNVRVTVTSGDPSRVLVSTNQMDEAASASVPVAGNPPYFWISALTDSGDVPITLTAPGFNQRIMMVHLAPLTFRLGPPSLTTTANDYARLSLTWSYPNTPTGYSQTSLRQNTRFTFSAIISDPTVLRNDSPSVTLSGYYSNLTLWALRPGSTTVTIVSTSAAVVDPNYATATVTINPRTMSSGVSALVLGKDMQRPLPYAGNNQAIVTLRSSDPARVLLTTDPGLRGKET
ncbi:MAG TPA: hypothetical protein VNH18_28725, partial [Bryobacteraceae bacterium]|nr:hypothetical protein [Bryobacteraceae bacterium]